jgi:uncharacterized protein YjiS (DUF1127 family)
MDRTLDSLPPLSPARPHLKLFGLLRQWRQNVRTRRQLAEMSGRELADAGISHCQRAEELSRPFWR